MANNWKPVYHCLNAYGGHHCGMQNAKFAYQRPEFERRMSLETTDLSLCEKCVNIRKRILKEKSRFNKKNNNA